MHRGPGVLISGFNARRDYLDIGFAPGINCTTNRTTFTLVITTCVYGILLLYSIFSQGDTMAKVTPTPPLLCKRCGDPLPGARVKSPSQGWYCAGCYYKVFIARIEADLLVTGNHYYEVVH